MYNVRNRNIKKTLKMIFLFANYQQNLLMTQMLLA